MRDKIQILSTKRLDAAQVQLFDAAVFDIRHSDFIHVALRPVSLEHTFGNLIFSSSNAVKAVLQNGDKSEIKSKRCFCVGEKTAALLKENGFHVQETANDAAALASIITTEYKEESFTFFSGNLRLDTLPEALEKANIQWNEIEAYETSFASKKMETKCEAILFFSPSAVASFLQHNTITDEACFCIGKTTAKALQNKADTLLTAQEPSVEAVIETCVRYLHPAPSTLQP